MDTRTKDAAMAEITDEIWNEIRTTLESWTEQQLIKSLTNHKFSEVYRRLFDEAKRAEEAEAIRLDGLPKPELVNQAMELVRKNHVFCAFVDCGGYSTVEFGHTRKANDSNIGDDNDDQRP